MKSSRAHISWLFSWTSCEAAAAAAAVAAADEAAAVGGGGGCGGCCWCEDWGCDEDDGKCNGSSSLEQRLFSSFGGCDEQVEVEAVESMTDVRWLGNFISWDGYGQPPWKK